MNSTNLFYVLAAILLALGVGAYLLNKDTIDWDITYDPKSEQPYGLYYNFKWFSEHWDKDGTIDLVKNDLKTTFKARPTDSLYVLNGAGWDINPEEATRFIEHLAVGNDALIALEVLPSSLSEALGIFMDTLQTDTDTLEYFNNPVFFESIYEQSAHFSFERAQNVVFQFGAPKGVLGYHYSTIQFQKEVSSENMLEIYESYDSEWYAVLEKIQVGKGHLYLFSTPILLTNYGLKNRPIFDLMANALAPIRGKDILWDEKHKLSFLEASNENTKDPTSTTANSPLTLLLKHRALRAAWYILVTLTILYLLVQSKRKQRIIPVVKEKRNSALTFARSIGKLHFKNADDRKLCLKRMQHFLYYMREKHHFHIKPEDQHFSKQLAVLLEVPETKIAAIIKEYRLIYKAGSITAARALTFCKNLQALRETL